MSKAYSQTIESIEEVTSKGAYMVYDHSEDEAETVNRGHKASFAILELTILLGTTLFLIAYSII